MSLEQMLQPAWPRRRAAHDAAIRLRILTSGWEDRMPMRWEEPCSTRLRLPSQVRRSGGIWRSGRRHHGWPVLGMVSLAIASCAHALPMADPFDGGSTTGDDGMADPAQDGSLSPSSGGHVAPGNDDGGGSGSSGGGPADDSGGGGGRPADGSGSRGGGSDGAGATADAFVGPCNAQSCSGCCDLGGNCSAGTLDTACGMGGACQDCTLVGRTCQAGACSGGASDAAGPGSSSGGGSMCNIVSCLSGCCQSGTCVQSAANNACGLLGLPCLDCTRMKQVCSRGLCMLPLPEGGP